MKTLEYVTLRCELCEHEARFIDSDFLARFDEPMTLSNVWRAAEKSRCSKCNGRRIVVVDSNSREIFRRSSLKRCSVCSQPIPMLRLKSLPGASVCLDCSAKPKSSPPPPHANPPKGKSKCPRCKAPTIINLRNEDMAPFIGCTNFPRCRWTASI